MRRSSTASTSYLAAALPYTYPQPNPEPEPNTGAGARPWASPWASPEPDPEPVPNGDPGKEHLLARVAFPSTDPKLFAYLSPLLAESRRALDALPPDGPHDPKILMRVDWGTGEPLLASETIQGGEGEGGGEAGSEGGGEGGGDVFLKKALVKHASSLTVPERKL